MLDISSVWSFRLWKINEKGPKMFNLVVCIFGLFLSSAGELRNF